MNGFRIVLVLAGATALVACQKQVEAPGAPGVCYQMIEQAKQPPKFNPVASGVPDLEHCAAALEGMRIRFEQLGLPRDRVTGAYQGQFLFLNPTGVFTSSALDGYHYPFMVRTGDGRLAVPGAMPQQGRQ